MFEIERGISYRWRSEVSVRPSAIFQTLFPAGLGLTFQPAVETIGYVGRALNSRETPDWTLAPFILQSLFILVATVAIVASVYMVLSRVVRLVGGEHLSPIRRGLITKLFILADFMAFMMQSTGTASSPRSANKVFLSCDFQALTIFYL